MKSKGTTRYIFIVLFSLLFLIFLIKGLLDLYKATMININRQETIGKITDVQNVWSFRICHPCQIYTFIFESQNGERFTGEQKLYFIPNYTIGDNVKILYDKINPQLSILEYSYVSIWLGAIGEIILGLISFVFIIPFVQFLIKHIR